MAVNKVVFGSVTLIDTSDVTVTPEKLFEGETALGADGELKTGTFTIEPELTEQDALLTELEAALEGKAGGGGSVESVNTCSLDIVLSQEYIKPYLLMHVYQDGVVTPLMLFLETVGTYTVNNVVCGSGVAVCPYEESKMSLRNMTGIEEMEGVYPTTRLRALKVSGTAGQMCSVDLYDPAN